MSNNVFTAPLSARDVIIVSDHSTHEAIMPLMDVSNARLVSLVRCLATSRVDIEGRAR